jgi:hypothetical protein
MPKATITTEDGAKIVIEGSAEEVRELLGRFHTPGKQSRSSKQTRPGRKPGKTLPSMADGIIELKQEGFFKKPKGLADIKEKLASMGMIYPLTSISGTVLSLVKKRALGRVKEERRWCYVTR